MALARTQDNNMSNSNDEMKTDHCMNSSSKCVLRTKFGPNSVVNCGEM